MNILTESRDVLEPLLHQKCEPIAKINDHVRAVAAEMLDLMGLEDGKGSKIGALAAPQVGAPIRLIVIKCRGVEAILVNPEIVKARGEQIAREECISLPGRFFKVKRPQVVKVRGLDLNGEKSTLKAHDQLAAVLCHEIDHLEGVMVNEIGEEESRW